MIILGINAYHGDSSACLLIDGEIRCAIEEERIRRIKHWAGVPVEAVRWCLEYEGLSIEDVDYIAVSRDPRAHLFKKLLRLVTKSPSVRFIKDRFTNASRIMDIRKVIAEEIGIDPSALKAGSVNVEHHRAHIASSYYPYQPGDAACISVDGFGDFLSVMRGNFVNGEFKLIDQVEFPHSLGIFYTAFTQFLGFTSYGDEYKVMGLSAYGLPSYMNQMRQVVKLQGNGLFKLDTAYFVHEKNGVEMTWNNSAPRLGTIYSERLRDILGDPRLETQPLNDHHRDIAASVQTIYEEAFFHMLGDLHEKTGMKTLCLAGGCIQNSLANGKILQNTPFENVYIPPSAHDGGTSVGAALWAWNDRRENNNGSTLNTSPYLGPEFGNAAAESAILENDLSYVVLTDEELYKKVAGYLAEGLVVGWFRGRSEWGPRALGNRSILADPGRADMKDIINSKIKFREEFRPFAPSVLEEHVGEWFELDRPVPYMEMVYPIKQKMRELIPAVCHADGTGRLQTVSRDMNPAFYDLINEFYKIRNIPMLLNTSFNENEPIVNTPREAIDCFKRTQMDVLVIGNFVIER